MAYGMADVQYAVDESFSDDVSDSVNLQIVGEEGVEGISWYHEWFMFSDGIMRMLSGW